MSKTPTIVKKIQKYKPHEIKWGFDTDISYSQISVYKECPMRWSLHYKDKIRPFTSSIFTIFGKAIHETLQHYLTVMYEESTIKADILDLKEEFEDILRKEYQKEYKNNNGAHFSTSLELNEFYEQGLLIIEFFKKNKNKYFSKRGWHLVGCEFPLVINPDQYHPSLWFLGYLDLVFYHEPTETFKIIDIKTATWGWGAKMKKDPMKQLQLVFYKKYFAQLFNVPLDKIEIEFFIVKRKLYENTDFYISRIQQHIPASGKVKLNLATKIVKEFIEEVFDKGGKIKERKFKATPSEKSCFYCPYNQTKHCKVGVKKKEYVTKKTN